jgi:uroporphyrinogen decarboxylase
MTARKRIETLVNGQQVDRVPISFWRHFPIMDRDQKLLAESLVRFQQTYELDFVKMMPNGLYSAADFGIRIAYTNDYRKTDEIECYGIERPEDWEHLSRFNPEKGIFFQQLESLARVLDTVGESIPVVETVFSPLTTAIKIAGPNLITHLRKYPSKVHAGLEFLTEITIKFVHRCLEMGIDGIFFATKCATGELLTIEEYNQFGRLYDLLVLEEAQPFWFNILHVHGVDTYDLFDYPVTALNYHDRRCARCLKDTRALFSGVLIGGIDEANTLVNGPEERIWQEVKEAINQLGGKGLIVGPGCVVDPDTPEEFLHAVRQAVKPI